MNSLSNYLNVTINKLYSKMIKWFLAMKKRLPGIVLLDATTKNIWCLNSDYYNKYIGFLKFDDRCKFQINN